MANPEKKFVSSRILFETAWDYQDRLSKLQGEINDSIFEVQTAVSGVLKNSTVETLHQFEDHVETVIDDYSPHLELFNQLKPGDCKNSAERILNTALEFTGFDAAVCAFNYNGKVQLRIDDASKALIHFDDVYSQVQMIVVKAFSGLNAFLTPDEIENRITEVYELVKGKWDVSKPEIGALVRNLATAIAEQNSELGRCHDKIMIDASFQFAYFGRMTQTCIDFNNSQDSTGRLGRTVLPYEQLFEEYQTEFAKLKFYEWTV